ncbi:beta-galactosidase [Candidatus Latescibacterota bacterium]
MKNPVRFPMIVCFILITMVFAHSSPGSDSLTSEVKMYNNLPALFVNGKLHSQMIYFCRIEDYEDGLKAGFPIVQIPLGFGVKAPPGVETGSTDWSNPDLYDFTRADADIEAILKMNPDVLLLPRFSFSPGEWWFTAFPDEIALRHDGRHVGVDDGQKYPSYASESYRKISIGALQAFITHIESRYGDSILGYQVCNGHYGEWFSWNIFSDVHSRPRTGLAEYSPAIQEAFRKWLREKYHDNREEFARAWGNTFLTFESAAIPTEEMRRNPHHGIFFDPSVSRRVPDYFEFYNDLVSDVLLEQCRTVKDACGRRKIVGVFYGYLWTNYPHVSMNHSGHLGFARVLRSPDIDFIASPYSYDNRYVGGFNDAQTLPESIALHGKLYINEVDTETHLQQRQWRWKPSLNNPRTFEETRGLLIRDFACSFARGVGIWYMDLLRNMYSDPDIIRLFSQLLELDAKYLEINKEHDPEVAVVIDDKSYTYFTDGEPFLQALMNVQKSWELAYMGMPFDTILLSDLAENWTRNYKFYIFLNTFRVTPEQREALHGQFQRTHATVLWVYAPGYIDQNLSVENIKALTGIQLFEHDTPGELRVEITSFDHPYTGSLPRRGMSYGTDVNVATIKPFFDQHLYLKDPVEPSRDLTGFSICPRFTGFDSDAAVLGHLTGLNQPGLLVKELDGWTSVYSAAPIVPAAILRNIARDAGCHVYSEANDVIYANRNFLAVYSPSGGERIIHLPRKARVIDMLEDKVIAKGAEKFTLFMNDNETRIFLLEE